MSEFRVVKRADLPKPRRGPAVRMPQARLHKSGTLYLSVVAVEALGNRDCQVMVEFDEDAMILKFTVVDKLPKGISVADLFPLHIKTGKRNKRPLGMVYLKSLLSFIGHPPNGRSVDFPVAGYDPVNRSISLVLPAEQMSCNGSSN